MPELNERTVLHSRALTQVERKHATVLIDAEGPNWVSADRRGAWLLRAAMEPPAPFSQLVSRYGHHHQLDSAKAWVHVQALVSEALRHGILSLRPVEYPPYAGRDHYLSVSRLRECWLHMNNSCNLSCAHCLVSASPRGEHGLSTVFWRSIIDQAAALGVDRFYITGGEPFVRDDLPKVLRHITEHHRIEVIVLTNATLFQAPRRRVLESLNRELVKFQVSVDGSTPAINDPIRGKGSFAATASGMQELARYGFEMTLTTVATGGNLDDLPNLTRLAKACGARAQHLMWIHRRGRVAGAPQPSLGSGDGAASVGRVADEQNGSPSTAPRTVLSERSASKDWFPSTDRLIEAVRQVRREAERHGIVLDNDASFELRANAPRGIKFDLGNAGWQSLCVYANGHVYPSAAMANHAPLDCGDAANGRDLERIWHESPILQRIREASVVRKATVKEDPLRYLTGGGDLEHSYFYSGDFLGDDPYYPLYRELLLEAMDRLTERKRSLINQRSGYDAPRIFHAMGDGAVACGTTEVGAEDVEVAFLHSNCVLSFDVEKPRKLVQGFYGSAAEQPQAELCCPTKYDDGDIGHIPQEVLDRFYGCGSPVSAARPQPGEVYVDLGSGAGIDCFIAAKRVGPTGRVIGIDMTDPMLAVAREHQAQVAAALGYDVVEFRKGYLEEIPVEAKHADVVTSNCVINLSADKPKVFAELWRILKDHGRAVIADIVSDREVPPQLKVNEQLWGECIVGALTEEQFLAMLEQAGFYGLSVMKKTLWKTIEGFTFSSVTVQGFKFEKTRGCQFIGQSAVYHGPHKAVLDEEGHCFPRNVAITVCTDTARKLAQPPYAGQFAIVEPDGSTQEPALACCPSESSSESGSRGACC